MEQTHPARGKEFLFLVSSALETGWGVYGMEERLAQTLGTLRSIRTRCPADIILLDGGDRIPGAATMARIKPFVTHFLGFSEFEKVRVVRKIPSHDIVKNLIEITMFSTFFSNMVPENFPWIRKYQRIFKMSGRYELNDGFDAGVHRAAAGKVVLRGPFPSQFPLETTGGVRLQYMSRLWSFDTCLLPQVTACYRKMLRHMTERLAQGGYIDIEHLLYVHLDGNLVSLVDRIGVEGRIAPNGLAVSD